MISAGQLQQVLVELIPAGYRDSFEMMERTVPGGHFDVKLGPYTHLTSEQRAQIELLHKEGHSRAEIGRHLGRHETTIGREMRRAGKEDGGQRRARMLTRCVCAEWRAGYV